MNKILPCHVYDDHVCSPYVLSSFSSSFCGLYVHSSQFLPILPSWDLPLHDDDLCGDLLLASVGMGLGEPLQEGLPDTLLEPEETVEFPEVHKAWPLEVQVGTGGTFLVQVQQGKQGCSREDRQGFEGPLEGLSEEADLI